LAPSSGDIVPFRSVLSGAAPPVVGPAVGILALAAAAVVVAGGRNVAQFVSRRAVASKKGVRVVDGKEIPWNLFSPKAPYKGTCISKESITQKTELVNWEVCHVVVRHDKTVPYVEGQSIGVVAPGPDKKGETPAKVRLYSIPSSACGDDETFETISLCVKRVVEVEGRNRCEYSNVEPGTDPEFPDAKKVYRGVCSSHICDLEVGDDVLLTGPTGSEMLLPDDPEANIIMLATGTGIAPFRSFLRKLFHDKATKGKFTGLAWLFLGVPTTGAVLYDDEWKVMRESYPDQFRYDYAISNEMTTKDGQPMYVQHKMMEYGDEIWPLFEDPKTHVYMCGLKGMEGGLKEAFGPLAEKDGIDWTDFVSQMKKGNRYHCEVY